jgi:hypothetical protein
MLLRMRAVDMVEDAGYASVEAADADEALMESTCRATTKCLPGLQPIAAILAQLECRACRVMARKLIVAVSMLTAAKRSGKLS